MNNTKANVATVIKIGTVTTVFGKTKRNQNRGFRPSRHSFEAWQLWLVTLDRLERWYHAVQVTYPTHLAMWLSLGLCPRGEVITASYLISSRVTCLATPACGVCHHLTSAQLSRHAHEPDHEWQSPSLRTDRKLNRIENCGFPVKPNRNRSPTENMEL